MIHLDDGFLPGKIYEIVYTAADPAVVGTGLAAVRDFASYMKNDPDAVVHGKYAYAMGISQTGRLLRHLVWQGFNADEQGRVDVFLAALDYDCLRNSSRQHRVVRVFAEGISDLLDLDLSG